MFENKKYLLLNGMELQDAKESLPEFLRSFDVLTVTTIAEIPGQSVILDSTVRQPPFLATNQICPNAEYLFFDLSLLGDRIVEEVFNDRNTDLFHIALGTKDLEHVRLMNDMIRTYQKSDDRLMGEKIVSSILVNNILHLKNAFESTIGTAPDFINERAPWSYRETVELFRGMIVQNVRKHRSVNYYSGLLRVSSRTLSTITRTVLDKSPKQLINEYMMELSKKLLEEKKLSVKQIAYELGFRSPNNFNMFFRKHLDISPGEYQRNQYRLG